MPITTLTQAGEYLPPSRSKGDHHHGRQSQDALLILAANVKEISCCAQTRLKPAVEDVCDLKYHAGLHHPRPNAISSRY